jgi:malate synthase
LLAERPGNATPSARRDADHELPYRDAVALFSEVALADGYADFLTIPAYERMP